MVGGAVTVEGGEQPRDTPPPSRPNPLPQAHPLRLPLPQPIKILSPSPSPAPSHSPISPHPPSPPPSQFLNPSTPSTHPSPHGTLRHVAVRDAARAQHAPQLLAVRRRVAAGAHVGRRHDLQQRHTFRGKGVWGWVGWGWLEVARFQDWEQNGWGWCGSGWWAGLVGGVCAWVILLPPAKLTE